MFNPQPKDEFHTLLGIRTLFYSLSVTQTLLGPTQDISEDVENATARLIGVAEASEAD